MLTENGGIPPGVPAAGTPADISPGASSNQLFLILSGRTENGLSAEHSAQEAISTTARHDPRTPHEFTHVRY
ncbi:hypothetical protein ACWGMA_06185 [Streptomyces asiaticus]